MAEIISNQFSSTISRVTTVTKEITSNKFVTIIGRDKDDPASDDTLSTTINIYKTGVLLTAVNENPGIGEYTVTITNTVGCTASLESNNKTIKVNSAISNSGRIDIVINIEGKQNYGKSIPVAAIPDTIKLNSSIGIAQSTANNAQDSASNAQTTANEALNKANEASNAASTAGNSAQQALEAANAADTRAYQALQRVDIGATNWDAAYNNVVNWASGDISNTITIDGGKIAAGTITASAIKSDAISGKDISGGTITGAYIISRSGNYYTALNNGYIYTNNHIVFEQNSPGLKGTYSNGSIATICHISRNDEMIFGYGSYDSTQSGTAYNNGTEYRGGSKTILKSKGSVWLGCNDGIVNSTGGQSIIYVLNSAGEYTFRSNGSGKTQLGYSNMPWKIVHSNSFNNTSDRTFKKDIKYISNANTIANDELTIDDCYNFIKNEVPIATYKYKEDKDNRTKVGFIAQDLLCDAKGNDCKVGQILMTKLENSEEGEKLGYDINNALGIMMAAMQAMAKKIEALENKNKKQVIETK